MPEGGDGDGLPTLGSPRTALIGEGVGTLLREGRWWTAPEEDVGRSSSKGLDVPSRVVIGKCQRRFFFLAVDEMILS